MKGIAASQGIAIAKVYKLEQPVIEIGLAVKSVEEELAILEKAMVKTVSDIEMIKAVASKSLKEEELEIFDAHLMMVNDPEYRISIEASIRQGGVSAAGATKNVSDMMVGMFESMDDEYMKARAADIRDVSFRLLCNILGKEIPNLATLQEPVVIVAKDLTPSDTGSLNKEYAKGFATEMGGRTSHSAIMARSLEIPAVVGCGDLLSQVKNGDEIILDAITGEIILHPTAEQIASYQEKLAIFQREKEELKNLKDQASITLDGHQVDLVGNIGEGVGLFRTEFLYMKSEDDFPSEEVQFSAYKQVLEAMQGRQVVIRTLDIGGDKKLNYYQFEEEMNPFLGVRAVRFCLMRKDIFRTQLRALLRASVYGKLAIMFPMIATVNEFREAKKLYDEIRAELEQEGVKVGNVQVGIMIEIPAAAVNADQLAKEADFFSIGTNDLIQYTMAADRMSQNVSYLYQPFNPSVLRLIKMAIDGAHSQGKWCGMCGEMAGDAQAAPVLLGLGLDEFSMSAVSILATRKVINGLNYEAMKKLANECVQLATAEEVKAHVEKVLR